MKIKHLPKFCLILLIIFSTKFFGQTKDNSIEVKKQYQYSFLGQLNAQSIIELEKKLAALEFVTMAKIKYKADSQKGEVFLHTQERTATSESDKGFDLIELKKLLISNNLSPLELTSTTLK
ncbi:MAG: hypothetical protein Q8L81_06450 [Bacteroidota bacterium]|nr:hypothetical protein [Bacteroidota bacterium]